MRVRSRLEGTDASELMPIPPLPAPSPAPKTAELGSVGVSRSAPVGSRASRAQAAGK